MLVESAHAASELGVDGDNDALSRRSEHQSEWVAVFIIIIININ